MIFHQEIRVEILAIFVKYSIFWQITGDQSKSFVMFNQTSDGTLREFFMFNVFVSFFFFQFWNLNILNMDRHINSQTAYWRPHINFI